MRYLITGGSASGKSEIGENLCVQLHQDSNAMVYLATMQPQGSDALQKIERHRRLRKNKGFETIEQFDDIHTISNQLISGRILLLECIGNLLANERYLHQHPFTLCEKKIFEGVCFLEEHTRHILIISNDIFSDGMDYDFETQQYICSLGRINQILAQWADVVIEAVYGLQQVYKGRQYL